MLALRMEAVGLHPFHASAVRYRDRTVLFLGGESNHGKSMGQIEACRRGALLVSTETTVIDEDGRAVDGLQGAVPQEAHRGHRAGRQGRAGARRRRSSSARCRPGRSTPSRADVDVVIVPAIDGNFDPSRAEMIPFERQFQTFHSLQNYFLPTSCSRPGIPMPLVDTDALRDARADFVRRFCRAALLLRPGGHAAGAPGRGGSGALEPTDASLRLRAADAASPTPSALLAEHGPEARLLAGGTDLIIRLRDGTIRPRVVVDVKRIAELDADIRDADGGAARSGRGRR